MITPIQDVLQKHHKCLLGILLFVIIVSFVFTIGASPGIWKSKTKHVCLRGRDLENKSQMESVARDVIYSAAIARHDIGAVQKNLPKLMIRRIISLGLADEFKIPNPPEKKLAEYVKTIPAFIDDDGKFSKDLYSSILEALNRTVGSCYFSKLLCENYKIEKVESMLAGDGVVFSEQVFSHLRKVNTEYDFIVATIDGSDIVVDEDVSDAAIEDFYKEYGDFYARPQTYTASMMKFENEDFESEVGDPNDEKLLEFFSENEKEFGTDADFQEIKDTVRKAYILAESTKVAYAAAESFVDDLYKNDVKLSGEEFARMLEKFGTKVEKLEPFSREGLPNVDGFNGAYFLDICNLSDDRYYTGPYPAAFGCAVLFFEGKEDARKLTIDEARSMVVDDVIRKRKVDKFTAKVEEIRKKVVVAIESGTNIADILSEDGVSVEEFHGVSIENAREKGTDYLYTMAIQSIGETEKIKLLALSDEEVLMFVVMGKNIPPDSAFAGSEKYENAEKLLKEHNKSVVLHDFFENQGATFVPVVELTLSRSGK
jgi:peptidyl-prolyl cis-trans isomerase D